jgi:hypothetical protein
MFTMVPGLTWIAGLKWAVIVGVFGGILFTANSYMKEYERRGLAEINLTHELKESEALRVVAEGQKKLDDTALATLNDRLKGVNDTLEANCKLLDKALKSVDPDVTGETLEEIERRENHGVKVIRP